MVFRVGAFSLDRMVWEYPYAVQVSGDNREPYPVYNTGHYSRLHRATVSRYRQW